MFLPTRIKTFSHVSMDTSSHPVSTCCGLSPVGTTSSPCYRKYKCPILQEQRSESGTYALSSSSRCSWTQEELSPPPVPLKLHGAARAEGQRDFSDFILTLFPSGWVLSCSSVGGGLCVGKCMFSLDMCLRTMSYWPECPKEKVVMVGVGGWGSYKHENMCIWSLQILQTDANSKYR